MLATGDVLVARKAGSQTKEQTREHGQAGGKSQYAPVKREIEKSLVRPRAQK
jgi:hypothetical protein